MNAYPNELRQRIVNHAKHYSIRETAQVFQVSPGTVFRLKKLHSETGDIVPRAPRKVGRRAVSPEGELYLQAILAEEADLTLEELCGRYEDAYGIRIGVTTMHNTLKRMGYSRKKNIL